MKKSIQKNVNERKTVKHKQKNMQNLLKEKNETKRKKYEKEQRKSLSIFTKKRKKESIYMY